MTPVRLSDHFTLNELCESDTATRLGIPNTAPPDLLEPGRILAAGLERARYVLDSPIHANSGYRCEALERVICEPDYLAWCARRGVMASISAWSQYFAGKQHPKFLAADITARKFGTPRQIVEKLQQEREFVRFDKCILEGTWVHIAFPPEGTEPRMQVMTASFTDGVPNYTAGIS